MGTRDVAVPKLEEPVIMWCYDTRGRGELGLSTQRDRRPAAWAAGSVSLLRGPASTMDAQNEPGAAAEKAQCVGTSLHEDPVSPTAALSHFPRKTNVILGLWHEAICHTCAHGVCLVCWAFPVLSLHVRKHTRAPCQSPGVGMPRVLCHVLSRGVHGLLSKPPSTRVPVEAGGGLRGKGVPAAVWGAQAQGQRSSGCAGQREPRDVSSPRL